MAVRSPIQDDRWSSTGAPPDAPPTTHDGPRLGPVAPTEGTLDLGLVRAVIGDGLLMVFGPDGDPVPPHAFGAAAAAQPDAGIRFRDGLRIRAERIAAVLDAQMAGRLGSGQDSDDAWIEVMLGVGPGPEMVGPEQLLAEAGVVQVIARGDELGITAPNGAVFLVAEACSGAPESVSLRVADEGPLGPGELVARLRGGAQETGDLPSGAAEVARSECRAWIEDDAIVIDLPSLGAVHLRRSMGAVSGPAASLVTSTGETATLGDLAHALGQPAGTSPSDRQADWLASAQAQAGAEPQAAFGARRISLPDSLLAGSDRVALIVVRGLPEGASLSAGVESGDGSWLLSPRHMAELSLTPPPDLSADLALEVAAITVADGEGELASVSTTVLVPLRSEVTGSGPAPIALGLDPEAMSERGRFDAVLVRDVPAGALLSAGTYDPAIDGWVLLPRQLSGLSVTPAGDVSEDFTLTLVGVSLQPGGEARPQVLAQVPVTVR